MLDRLLDYADRHNLQTEPGFAAKTVKWGIACTQNGEFSAVLDLGEGRGRVFARAPYLSQPELIGGSTARSHFLVDALSTVALLLKPDAAEGEVARAEAKHRFFVEMLEDAAEAVPDLGLAATMLADPEQLQRVREALNSHKAKPTDTATIIVRGALPLDEGGWEDWWRAKRRRFTNGSPGMDARRDLLTGDWAPPAPTHPKIRGLAGVGGLAAGDVLVGFDKAAFQSYGLKQSANAAMSAGTATAYSEALNHLIATNGKRLGNVLAVYWYQQRVEQEHDVMAWLEEPPETEAAGAEALVRDLLAAIRAGNPPANLADNRYHALTLSGAAGRVMVRDWMEGAFEDLVANVHGWFSDLDVVDPFGGQARAPKFLTVAGSVVRELDDLPAPLVRTLFRAAVTGGPIPQAALAMAVQRVRVAVVTDEESNPKTRWRMRPRMALIKAYHRRNRPNGGSPVERTVNPEHPDTAYHCGRLLAVLAALQRKALGDVGAGVVQRYYTAASQTPALLVGRLVANAKNHLNKIEPPGLAYWFETRIAEIMVRIGDQAPRTLDLERQSLFALGYYQQLAELRTKKKVEGSGEVIDAPPPETTEEA
jgi:CRISPR-associated protein Csd1